MGGYYGVALLVFWGLTQGYLLSPIIFNAVVDTVVRNWVSLVAGYAGVQDRLGREVLHCTAFFYMGYSLVASTDPEWMQGASESLTGLFERVGLWTNTSKTVGMLYRP